MTEQEKDLQSESETPEEAKEIDSEVVLPEADQLGDSRVANVEEKIESETE